VRFAKQIAFLTALLVKFLCTFVLGKKILSFILTNLLTLCQWINKREFDSICKELSITKITSIN
jgi:hypothetical protein